MNTSTRWLIPIVVVAVTSLIATVTNAATIFVAPSGRADAAGTQDAPMANLPEAVAHAKAGDTIHVATGTYIGGGGSDNLIFNCESFRNFDPNTKGENADGFAAKHDVGPGNVFRGCRSYQNSDDGWDLWMAPNPILIEDCVAFRNGYN